MINLYSPDSDICFRCLGEEGINMFAVRIASETDAEILSGIQKQAFLPLYKKYHDPNNPYLRRTDDMLHKIHTPAFRCFAILDDDKIIGGIFYRRGGRETPVDLPCDREYYLQRIFVAPAHQGKGAASGAIRLCENELHDAVKFTVEFPADLLKNRRCYEKAGYRDTGKRFEAEKGLILACFEKETGKAADQIRPVCYDMLPDVLDVIRAGFAAAAAEFGLTRENCPRDTSFIPIETLQTHMQLGWYMFGLFDGEKLIGYASLSDEGDSVYELHSLAVLREYRNKGCGKALLDHAKEKVRAFGGTKIEIGIIEENKVLKEWYRKNGFAHTGTKKFDHLPFTSGYMEWGV